jgi:hypothetical protein
VNSGNCDCGWNDGGTADCTRGDDWNDLGTANRARDWNDTDTATHTATADYDSTANRDRDSTSTATRSGATGIFDRDSTAQHRIRDHTSSSPASADALRTARVRLHRQRQALTSLPSVPSGRPRARFSRAPDFRSKRTQLGVYKRFRTFLQPSRTAGSGTQSGRDLLAAGTGSCPNAGEDRFAVRVASSRGGVGGTATAGFQTRRRLTG